MIYISLSLFFLLFFFIHSCGWVGGRIYLFGVLHIHILYLLYGDHRKKRCVCCITIIQYVGSRTSLCMCIYSFDFDFVKPAQVHMGRRENRKNRERERVKSSPNRRKKKMIINLPKTSY